MKPDRSANVPLKSPKHVGVIYCNKVVLIIGVCSLVGLYLKLRNFKCLKTMAMDRVDCIGDSDYYEIRTFMVYANLVIFTMNRACSLDKVTKASLANFTEEII